MLHYFDTSGCVSSFPSELYYATVKIATGKKFYDLCGKGCGAREMNKEWVSYKDHPSFPLWTALPLPLLLGWLQGSAAEQSIAVRLRVTLMLCWTPSHSSILVRILLMQLPFAGSDLAQWVYKRLWKIKLALCSTFVFSRMLSLIKKGWWVLFKTRVQVHLPACPCFWDEENIIFYNLQRKYRHLVFLQH